MNTTAIIAAVRNTLGRFGVTRPRTADGIMHTFHKQLRQLRELSEQRDRELNKLDEQIAALNRRADDVAEDMNKADLLSARIENFLHP